MEILYTIIIGFIIGLVAKLIMGGGGAGGFIITTLLGIGGALVAHFIGATFGWYLPGQPAGFIASILGAMLLLFIFHKANSRRAI
jgi:uncharacterized membrane protein YeaQ/YmgE (transglycosylase-associated protein family)